MNYQNHWHTPVRNQMRHDYAHCGWKYGNTPTRRMRWVQAVCCVLVFALIGVMLAIRG